MNKEVLRKSLLCGILSGVLTWLVYGLVFQVLLDKKPLAEGLFGRSSIFFLIVFTVVETVVYYIAESKKNGKE